MNRLGLGQHHRGLCLAQFDLQNRSGELVAEPSATLGSFFSRRAARAAGLRAVLYAEHQSEPGPNLVNGAHFVVDDPPGQARVSDVVFADVGDYAGSFLRPADPQTAARM